MGVKSRPPVAPERRGAILVVAGGCWVAVGAVGVADGGTVGLVVFKLDSGSGSATDVKLPAAAAFRELLSAISILLVNLSDIKDCGQDRPSRYHDHFDSGQGTTAQRNLASRTPTTLKSTVTAFMTSPSIRIITSSSIYKFVTGDGVMSHLASLSVIGQSIGTQVDDQII